MSDPAFDGLCGIPGPSFRDGTYMRCTHELEHHGDHSWEKFKHHFRIFGGITADEFYARMYPVPNGCTCKVIRTTEGEIADYVFKADCVPHSRKP